VFRDNLRLILPKHKKHNRYSCRVNLKAHTIIQNKIETWVWQRFLFWIFFFLSFDTKLGKIWNFCLSSMNWLIFLFFGKKFPNSWYYKIGKEKKKNNTWSMSSVYHIDAHYFGETLHSQRSLVFNASRYPYG
jgi:hypothetical protein